MGVYTIRRLIWVPLTAILVSMLIFLTVRFIPGNIIDTMESQIAQFSSGPLPPRLALEHALGLDVPFYVQYARWIGSIVLHGSLGTSLVNNSDITPRVLAALPVTLELSILAIIVGILISIPIGVYAALRQDTITDYIGRSIAIVLISVPSFWIGVMIMIYPSIWWHWSPSVELIPFIKDPLRNLGMFIIPSVVLGTALAGSTMRMTRTMMLEVLRQDYIRTAWAKGLTERLVVVRHALKNSLIPVVTVIGMQIPFLIGGAVIIEQIFVLPGIGTLILQALSQRDYPMVEGVSLVVSTFVIFVNLFVDLTYGLLDPRIHYQ
jgi:peptide/nickel transport system permease protein